MKNQRLFWIDPSSPAGAFPDIEAAMQEPDGLLAVGGDLSSDRLLTAYERGIFPWYVDDQPILWWSPDPRCILRPQDFHVSRRLGRELKRSPRKVSFNRAFDAVIEACAAPRPHQQGTWITADMADAYRRLHREGWAHSAEVWQDDLLIGGIYGIAIDRVFFGESMFTRESNASKMAFLALCRQLETMNFELLDCQVQSPHLLTLGAKTVPRAEFRTILEAACRERRALTGLPATDLIDVARLA